MDGKIIEFIKAIPNEMDWGRVYLVTCPCGGTIKAIRSINNGHLTAKCDGCGTRVMT